MTSSRILGSRRIPLHVLPQFQHHRSPPYSTYWKRHTIRMGTQANQGPRQTYHLNHQCTHPSQTQPRQTIRTRNRCFTNRNRSNTLPTGPPYHQTRRHSETRTMTTSGISLPKIHANQAKLPHLRLRIPWSHERTSLLVPLTQRNNNPHPSVY